MKLLADENLNLSVVARMREAGHQVLAVAEMEPGISDDVVLGRANVDPQRQTGSESAKPFHLQLTAKRASRREDCKRLANGESPAVLQRENSIFPSDFFKKAKISNLSDAVGR